ncbi:hypothetical protein H9X57_00860 [Flavobacterium piscinae]|uniref:hypothetical protein n=1 Tax=Flavobacterium piscinae TaxID=2506424 RepID=UPI00199D44F4|nr:hypothetical protein [Flavobacterium piscinae]
MATTTYELRKKPKLLFTLSDSDFHLIDEDNSANNGEFKYNSIISVDLVKGRTNWIVSIFSLVIDFILDLGSFSNYKEKDKLIFQLTSSKIEILLFKVNKKELETLVNSLKKNRHKKTPFFKRVFVFIPASCDTHSSHHHLLQFFLTVFLHPPFALV